MRIGKQNDRPPASLLRQRPVPDYTRRSTKVRLFALVAALMVVLAFAERVRDPQMWRWMWDFDGSAAPAEPKFDNRLKTKPLRTAFDPVGTFISEGDARPAADDAEQADRLAIDPVERAWDQGWKDVYDRLDVDRRALLFQMLHSGLSHAALDPEKQTAAGELLQAVTKLWEDYQVVAFQSVSELTGDDQALWVDVLRQVNNRFSEQVRPALQGVIDSRTLTEADELALRGLEQTLLKLTRTRIEDDTIFRPAEREIWFHELARVRDTPAPELREESLGQVAYLQLFHQPDDYRGQVVTLKGTVKLAYRVRAPENYLGIEQYYVFWLHPAGGPTSPVVVYALGAPPGFPEIKDKDLDRETTPLSEELAVTGVFFKRWAYLAKDGTETYTAPLVLANVPQWTPAPAIITAAERMPLTLGNLAAVFAATMVLALLVGLVLFRMASIRRPPTSDEPPADMAALRDVELKPTANEALREMERQARSRTLDS
jgi:hypothetical protein